MKVKVNIWFTEVGFSLLRDSWDAPLTDLSLVEDLSKSISVRTRKMVNYAWTGRSQGKLWWRLVAILTCKSFV
jgi:hypothetical protein